MGVWSTALFGLLLIVLCSSVLEVSAWLEGGSYDPDDKLLDQMPDYTKPKTRKKMLCSSCRCLAEDLYEQLMDVREKKGGTPKEYDLEAVLDGTCKRIRDKYGLLMRNNKPTTEFSRDEAITKLRGSWIGAFIESRCGELLSEYDEKIMANYATAGSAAAFQRLMCEQWDKNCKPTSGKTTTEGGEQKQEEL